jgi:MFS family permease
MSSQVLQELEPEIEQVEEVSVYKIRNVRVLLLQTFLGMVFTTVVLGPIFDGWLLTLAKERGYSKPNTLVGSVESVRGMTALILAFPLGMVSDKFSKSRAWLLKINCIVLVFGVVVLLFAIVTDTVTLLYVGVAVIATYNQMSRACTGTLLADTVQRKSLLQATTAISITSLVGASLGPLLQCVLIVAFGDEWDPTKLRISICTGFVFVVPIICTTLALSDPPCQSSAEEIGTESLIRECYHEKICGVRKRWLVPATLQVAAVVYGMGAGMTVRFFPLFFKEDFDFSPLGVNIIIASSRIFVAGFMKLSAKLSKRMGRMHAALLYDACGISCLIIMSQLQTPWPAVIVFLFRTAFSNASSPIEQAILFECVESKHRGRLSAVQSIFGITWSGSAALGGFLSDSHDYRFTFLFTALLYCVGLMIDLPMLCIVPRYSSA